MLITCHALDSTRETMVLETNTQGQS